MVAGFYMGLCETSLLKSFSLDFGLMLFLASSGVPKNEISVGNCSDKNGRALIPITQVSSHERCTVCRVFGLILRLACASTLFLQFLMDVFLVSAAASW